MKKLIIFIAVIVALDGFAQKAEPIKKTVEVNSTSFYYYESSVQSNSVVLVFHDWFGISDLSYEMLNRIQ